MLNKPDFTNLMYSKLPRVYKENDKTGELERFLKIFGEGANYVLDKIDMYDNLFDVDNVDETLLPYLARTLGFHFPYEIPVEDQRKFIKMLPTLYRMKGTQASFEYLGRELFNWNTVLLVDNEPETDNRRIRLTLNAYEGTKRLANKTNSYKRFAESLRPINTILEIVFSYMYQDIHSGYDYGDRAKELIQELKEDFFTGEGLTDTSEYGILKIIGEDELTQLFEDLESIRANTKNNETYTKKILEKSTYLIKQAFTYLDTYLKENLGDTLDTLLIATKPMKDTFDIGESYLSDEITEGAFSNKQLCTLNDNFVLNTKPKTFDEIIYPNGRRHMY